MFDLILLKMKEGKKKSAFIVFAILGSIITLIVSATTFSTNANYDLSSDYSQYGFQWTALSLIAALASVSLSSNSVEKHRRGQFSDLISLNGIGKKHQYWSLVIANIITSLQMALVLIAAMTLSFIIKKPDITFLSYLSALLSYLLLVSCVTVIITGLSFIFSPIVCNLLGVMLVILGSLRGVLDIVVGNLGGVVSVVLRNLLKLMPPISSFGQLSRDLFFGEFNSWNLFFSCLLYCWIALGVLMVIIYGVVKNER